VDPLSLRRLLASLTVASGVLVVLTLGVAPLLGAPLAVLFVLSAFGWNLVRADPAPRSASGVCAGCVAGCVGCRERIDA
jgi:hypothetical protein